MQITIELPEDFFTRPKTEAELLRDVQQAAAMYWIVRGDIPAERAPDVKTILGPPIDFKRALLWMPNVGEDSDFERKTDQPRAETQWDA